MKRVAGRLAEIKVIYADAAAGLIECRRLGLPDDARVRSASPGMLLSNSASIEAADEHISPAMIGEFRRDLHDWTARVFEKLKAEPAYGDAALVAARRVLRFQTQLYKFMALQESDFHQPVAALILDTGSDQLNDRVNAPWSRVLSSNPRFEEIRLRADRMGYAFDYSPPHARLINRLSFANWQTKGYRIALGLWRLMPSLTLRGTIFLADESPLLKEAAFAFARRGFSLRRLRQPNTVAQSSNEVEGSLYDCLATALRHDFEKLLAPSVVQPSLAALADAVWRDIRIYRERVTAWRESLKGLRSCDAKAVLINNTARPASVALFDACRERNLPVIAFQHGVTREIGANGDRDEVFYETTCADLYFTYNRQAERVTNEGLYARGKAITAGMHREHSRSARRRARGQNAPPVWYVSTALYTGNIQIVARGMTDRDLAKAEIALIDEVFSVLPHNVLYKPYPAKRYPDPDPVIERARAAENITLYEDRQDLRYIVHRSRILVTSRPTSTLGWCLASGRPVVFIDWPEEPVDEEARPALDKGLFLFSGRRPQVFAELREFLSQPIAEIERQWQARAGDRSEMVEEFFDSGRGDAGHRIASLLIDADFRPERIGMQEIGA